MLQKDLHYIGVSLLCSNVEGVHALVVVAIRKAAGLEQQLHDFCIAIAGSLMKSSIAVLRGAERLKQHMYIHIQRAK